MLRSKGMLGFGARSFGDLGARVEVQDSDYIKSSPPAAPRPWTTRIVYIAVLAAILVVAWTALGKPQEAASFERPDRHYKVAVVRRSTWGRPMMPGQSGDAPGLVRLYDRSGRMIQQAPVDMVQVVDGVEWQDHQVLIKLVADLPD